MPFMADDFSEKSSGSLYSLVTSSAGIVPFKELMSLLGIYKRSSIHIESLIRLLAIIVSGQSETVAEMDESSLHHVCGLLSYRALSEATVNSVIQLVKNLAKNDQNRSQIACVLSREVEQLATEVESRLVSRTLSDETHPELQLLRLVKVLKSVSGSASLSCLWAPLTEALSAPEEQLSQYFPIVETFFISYTDMRPDTEFFEFCESNRVVLNNIIENDPSLLKSSFGPLVA